MEMHQIRYFLAVVESLNFTRAAEECNVAQPSLSRAIRKLEEELGGDLFRRERSKTHLTDLGRTMLPLLRQSYDCAVAAKSQAASYGSAAYAPLSLGLSLTIDLETVGPILAELGRGFPGLELRLRRGDAASVLEALKAGEVELAIVAEDTVDWDRFDRWMLFEEGFVVVAPPGHALAGRDRVDLRDIADEAVIRRPYCESEAAFDAALEAGDVKVARRHVAASDADARALAALGYGLGILPGGATDGAIVLDPTFLRTVRAYGVAGRQRSPAAATLLQLLRAADWSARRHPA